LGWSHAIKLLLEPTIVQIGQEENEARPNGIAQEEEVHVEEPQILKGEAHGDKKTTNESRSRTRTYEDHSNNRGRTITYAYIRSGTIA
jgi:hypothetical protein